MEPVIRVSGIGKKYRIGGHTERYATLGDRLAAFARRPFARMRAEEFWALKDVDFHVEQGEVLGIVGRNGAGKTTLLKILSRITAPTEGRAVIHGRVASLLEVGTGFHPELTGRENVFLNGAILGMTRSEIQRKFDDIVEFAEVARFIDTPVKHYSSGMYLRLAFSVAAHLDPEVLIVDEVLAVGDASFQRKCMGKIGDVARGGRTVLFVSHNMPAVTSLCTRAILLEGGRLVRSGSPSDIVKEYLSGNADAVEPLAIRSQRSGSGKLRFEGIRVADAIYGRGSRVGCNHGCRFEIDYSAPGPLHNVSIAFHLTDPLGQRMFTAATLFLNADFEKLPTKGTLLCEVERLPLAPDTYGLELWASVNGEEADHVLDAARLDVVPTDVFGTGRAFTRAKHGVVFIPHAWRLEQ